MRSRGILCLVRGFILQNQNLSSVLLKQKKEAMMIVKSELPEDRWDAVEYEEHEYVDGKKYWVVFD